MKLNMLQSISKPSLIVAIAVGLAGAAIALPSDARKCENLGHHSGFHGNGGLGRGGYRFGDRFEDRHPRRSQVLSRDNRLNWRLNKDRGHLGGNYKQLEKEQIAIRRQEQADAKANGGYITRSERAQLNKEENQLNQQIHSDYRP